MILNEIKLGKIAREVELVCKEAAPENLKINRKLELGACFMPISGVPD